MNIKDYGFKENIVRNNTDGRIPARIIATHNAISIKLIISPYIIRATTPATKKMK